MSDRISPEEQQAIRARAEAEDWKRRATYAESCEREVSDAYLRVRKLLGAYGTDTSGANRFEVTEGCIAALQSRVVTAERRASQAADTVGWIRDALDGAPVSDFGKSFEMVREVLDVRARAEAAEARVARLRQAVVEIKNAQYTRRDADEGDLSIYLSMSS